MVQTEQERIEMLLRPRYKCVEDYPGNNYSVGEIIHLTNNKDESDEYYSVTEDNDFIEWEHFYKMFPNIFKPLSWWEERATEEMPEYVKDEFSGEILRARYIFVDGVIAEVETCSPGTDWHIDHIGDLTPATTAEYN